MPEVLDDSTASGEMCGASRDEQRLFDVQRFDDGFDNPVRVASAGRVLIEAAGSNARRDVRDEARIRLYRPEPLHAFIGGLA